MLPMFPAVETLRIMTSFSQRRKRTQEYLGMRRYYIQFST